MIISLIAALDREGGISKEGKIPWSLRTDLQRFKSLTLGHPVIMGRKTFSSIGKPLSERTNIVISRKHNFHSQHFILVSSLDQALALAVEMAGADEVFVIGGGEIYAQALPGADRLYLTFVDTVAGCDVFFPVINPAEWTETRRVDIPADSKNQYPSTFCIFDRKNSPSYSQLACSPQQP